MWERLRRRPLELYVLYRALAMTWAFMPFQVFFLEARGLTLAAVFDLNVVFSLATVAFEVPTGIFADRNGRRVAMAAAGFVMACACALFILGGGFWIYALANVLTALSMTLASGADSAFLYDHLAEQGRLAQYARYEGISTAAKGVGNLLAVLIGGVLFHVAPWSVFALTAVFTSTAGVIALALPEHAHPPRNSSVAEDLRRAAGVVRNDPRLATVLVYGAVTFVLLRMSLFTDQPHLELHLTGRGAAQLSLAAALLAAAKEVGGAVVASSAGSIFRVFRWRTVVVALAAFVAAVYAVMGIGIGSLDLVAMVVLTSSFGLFSPLMRALMNHVIRSSGDRATLLSFESMGRRLLFAGVSPLFGRAVESSSLHATFTGTAYVAAVVYAALGATAFALFRMRTARNANTSPSENGALASFLGS